jgi:hypothetical protein
MCFRVHINDTFNGERTVGKSIHLRGKQQRLARGSSKAKETIPREHRLPPNEHLELVCSLERTGIVGDVIFDLRHPKLDPIKWTAESLLRTREDKRRGPDRPYLWFPWYGEYTPDFSNISAQLGRVDEFSTNDVFGIPRLNQA